MQVSRRGFFGLLAGVLAASCGRPVLPTAPEVPRVSFVPLTPVEYGYSFDVSPALLAPARFSPALAPDLFGGNTMQTSGMAPQFSDGVRKQITGRKPPTARPAVPATPRVKLQPAPKARPAVPPAPGPAHRRGGFARHSGK